MKTAFLFMLMAGFCCTQSFAAGSKQPVERTVHELTEYAKGIWPDNAPMAITFAKEKAAEQCLALTGSRQFKTLSIQKAEVQYQCENYYYGWHWCDGATIRFYCSRNLSRK